MTRKTKDVSRLYTVAEVARMSGVSVRTLHHYDDLGLLTPARVGDNGYRLYGRAELLRLQQILFHRELEFPLEAIKAVLAAPDFDRLEALRRQKRALSDKAARYRRLLRTLDATLAELEGTTQMSDQDLYAGFTPEQQAGHEAWLSDRYGEGARDRIAGARAKMKRWSKGDFAAFKAEGEAIEQAMARALGEGLPVDSAAVRALMARHHAWVAASWPAPPTADAFAGLGAMYLEHPEFTARYEAIAAGLSEYLAEAMASYALAVLT
ncbi:MAG: MerR family transcriptional regulator [Caulobacter sp.]|nr:MerR family transcriptional regulator [Caulobacter sp.]